MVQYAIIRKATSPELSKAIINPADDYWKIRTPDFHKRDAIAKHLKGTNYARASDANRADLTKAYCRRQRGLLMYDRCSGDELRQFVTHRNIALSNLASATDETLIEALEQADEDMIFRLLDLPAELQLNILGQYLDDILPDPSSSYYGLMYPPIFRANRQLYQDTIKLFASKAIIPMDLYWPIVGDMDDPVQGYNLIGVPKEHLMPRQDFVAGIRRLHVWVNGIARINKHYGHVFFLITLPDTEDGRSKIEFVKGEAVLFEEKTKNHPQYVSKPMPKDLKETLEGLLCSVMGVVDGRMRLKRFTEDDLKAVKKAVRDCFVEWDS